MSKEELIYEALGEGYGFNGSRKDAVEMIQVILTSDWIPVKYLRPKSECLLKTSSGVVVIGDLYEGKWRVNGRWRYNGVEWVSEFKFDDITHWRFIPL